jgi:hypothetical protein
MGKMTLMLNYTNYVLDENVAIEMFKLLNKGGVERLESKWDSETKTSTVYLMRMKDDICLKRMDPEQYAVLKLATAAIEEQSK